MSYSITNIILLAMVFEWYNIGRYSWQVINNPITRISQIIHWILKDRLVPTKWYSNWVALIIYIIGWYLGFSLHNWFNCSQLGWILELILVTTLLAYKNMFYHVTNTLDYLYSTDLELCRYKLSLVVSKRVKKLDEHGICNSLLLALVENFNDGILLPLFYYLVAGLSGLMLYKTTDLIDSIFGNFKSSNRTFSLKVCKIDSIMSTFPCFALILLLNLIKIIKTNNINSLLNFQKWSIHFLILKLMPWFNIKIKTGGKYGGLYIIGKQLNNSNHLPNGLDIVRLKIMLCMFTTILIVFITVIKGIMSQISK
ncbi:cobalamin biosynthesis protein [Candidatus Hodgkinia cicadicola]|uniref:Cobalamin biosynthesis protein n=1 Tax=Candidatus Hodgkinia cicadicola TaxID=573658 RepID=A0ABX4MHS5_9HYPH|nr:cobalamin biosynthesis protein [Candidatus Hodgkinia cicadicola]